MLRGQASLLQQSSGGARVSKFVIYTYALYWSRMLFTEQRAYGLTQSANHTVFFTGDYFAAGFLYGLICGYSLEKCASIGSILSANIIQVIGANMPKERWDEIKLNINAVLSE